jgi:predicted DNA binding CopG/RHH family protein
MSTPQKSRPVFRTEDEERAFWATHSPLDFFDVSAAKRASFPNLRPSLKSISIRLPADMLDELKVLANKRDVPYQSLAKLYLAWGIKAERRPLRTEGRPARVKRSATPRLTTKRAS